MVTFRRQVTSTTTTTTTTIEEETVVRLGLRAPLPALETSVSRGSKVRKKRAIPPALIPGLASSESGRRSDRRDGALGQPLHVQQHDELALHGAAPSPPPATATAGSNSSSELERPSAILALLTLIKRLY